MTDPDEVPHDVRASLDQLLAEARAAARRGDADTARALLDTAETVATNKLPPGERRDRVRWGCAAALDALPNGDLAAAYAAATADVIGGDDA
ncbi:hypothetical protein PN416_10765 [Halorubrum ezzemoulense]|uniref:hypothetical protein n=1 Tax=Halorubrum TaxID=56688 RepID=UPI000A2E2DD2|nr:MULTISPECIES: hypothetical protein [Halorubrum]MDB2272020.1 hypothetical protein [Halorubrum ezzemoulense]MDB9280477.1 hypothetical protein [Halorubrum ezzemoulense]MDB9283916.1 hypothetical protein [Halorubrum ezzemoulense]OTF12048.1 hypothetical protein B9G38_03290 [Halorubrum sp. SD612]